MKLVLLTILLVGCGTYGTGVQNNTLKRLSGRYSKYANLAHLLTVQRDNDQGLDTGSPYDCERDGGIALCDRCLFVPHMNNTRDIDYDDAIALCKANGGQLAELHNVDEQQTLGDRLHYRMPRHHHYVYMWIGMQYRSETSTLEYRSGKEVPTDKLKWFQHYPNGTHPEVMAKIFIIPNFYALLWNQPRSYTMHGVVCEKKLWLK